MEWTHRTKSGEGVTVIVLIENSTFHEVYAMEQATKLMEEIQEEVNGWHKAYGSRFMKNYLKKR